MEAELIVLPFRNGVNNFRSLVNLFRNGVNLFRFSILRKVLLGRREVESEFSRSSVGVLSVEIGKV